MYIFLCIPPPARPIQILPWPSLPGQPLSSSSSSSRPFHYIYRIERVESGLEDEGFRDRRFVIGFGRNMVAMVRGGGHIPFSNSYV